MRRLLTAVGWESASGTILREAWKSHTAKHDIETCNSIDLVEEVSVITFVRDTWTCSMSNQNYGSLLTKVWLISQRYWSLGYAYMLLYWNGLRRNAQSI